MQVDEFERVVEAARDGQMRRTRIASDRLHLILVLGNSAGSSHHVHLAAVGRAPVHNDAIVAAAEHSRLVGSDGERRDALGVALDCALHRLLGRWRHVQVVDGARQRHGQHVLVLPQAAHLLILDRVAQLELSLHCDINNKNKQ